MDGELDPEAVLENSYELGTRVELRYAGANGTIVEQVAVAALDDAGVLVEDPDGGEQRWRKGVRGARPLEH